MYDFIHTLPTNQAINAVYYAMRLIRHAKQIKDLQLAVKGVPGEPSNADKEMGTRIVRAIEKTEKTLLLDLPRTAAERHIVSLSDLLQKLLQKRLAYPDKRGADLLQQLRTEHPSAQDSHASLLRRGVSVSMANAEHVDVVLRGSEAFATWREQNPDVQLDLSGANLRRAELIRFNLNGAILRDAKLEWADLRWADLIGADLTGANLSRADFYKADLADARFAKANLADCNLEDANCEDAEFDSAILVRTRLLNTDLRGASGLEAVVHRGPCVVDADTLMKADNLPSRFLRGCGLSDTAIAAAYHGNEETLATALESKEGFYTCFISYSAKDKSFAERLHTDLQNNGVRCWFAPADLKIGAKLRPAIDESIRMHDKLLIILSKNSAASNWVEHEVETALAREQEQNRIMLFPIRVDDAVMETKVGWPAHIKNTRNIGDFRHWKDPAAYQKSFARLLRDLKSSEEKKQ